VAKATKEAGISMALSGLGGDELFGGYSIFRQAPRLEQLSLLPRPLRDITQPNARFRTGGHFLHKVLYFLLFFGTPPADFEVT